MIIYSAINRYLCVVFTHSGCYPTPPHVFAMDSTIVHRDVSQLGFAPCHGYIDKTEGCILDIICLPPLLFEKIILQRYLEYMFSVKFICAVITKLF